MNDSDGPIGRIGNEFQVGEIERPMLPDSSEARAFMDMALQIADLEAKVEQLTQALAQREAEARAEFAVELARLHGHIEGLYIGIGDLCKEYDVPVPPGVAAALAARKEGEQCTG
jgi:citrate lyase beta subunit